MASLHQIHIHLDLEVFIAQQVRQTEIYRLILGNKVRSGYNRRIEVNKIDFKGRYTVMLSVTIRAMIPVHIPILLRPSPYSNCTAYRP